MTRPYDPYCKRYPDEIQECVGMARVEGMHPDKWVEEEEGTYNPENGHFACTECYIKLGMPSSAFGWKAP